jgi:hypothetical protein
LLTQSSTAAGSIISSSSSIAYIARITAHSVVID